MYAVLLLGALLAQSSPFEGTWSHDDVQVTLKQEGAKVTGQLLSADREGTVAANVLGGTAVGTFTVGTDSGLFMARPQDKQLVMSFNGVSVTCDRGKRKKTASVVKAAPTAAPVQKPVVAAPPKEEGVATAIGDETSGWRAVLPAGWRVEQMGPPMSARSAGEEGTIVIFHVPDATEEAASTLLTKPIPLGGATLVPAGPVSKLANQRANALAVNGSVARNGKTFNARTALAYRDGDAVVVAGVGDATSFETFKRRVDAIAQSVEFTHAPRPRYTISGGFCCIDKSSERYAMKFDGQGRATFRTPGSSFYMSPTATSPGLNAMTSGATKPASYSVQGDKLEVNLDTGGGRHCVVSEAEGRQIIAFKCGDERYSMELCRNW